MKSGEKKIPSFPFLFPFTTSSPSLKLKPDFFRSWNIDMKLIIGNYIYRYNFLKYNEFNSRKIQNKIIFKKWIPAISKINYKFSNLQWKAVIPFYSLQRDKSSRYRGHLLDIFEHLVFFIHHKHIIFALRRGHYGDCSETLKLFYTCSIKIYTYRAHF